MSATQSLRNDESGVAIPALVVVMAILVIFPATVFEFSRLFNQNQKLSLLVREAANVVFRHCAAYPETAGYGVPVGQSAFGCMNSAPGYANAFFSDAREVFPDGRFRVSIYRRSAGSSNPQLIAELAAPNTFTTRIDTNSTRLMRIVEENGIVVIAEGSVPYKSMFGLTWGIPENIYEAILF